MFSYWITLRSTLIWSKWLLNTLLTNVAANVVSTNIASCQFLMFIFFQAGWFVYGAWSLPCRAFVGWNWICTASGVRYSTISRIATWPFLYDSKHHLRFVYVWIMVKINFATTYIICLKIFQIAMDWWCLVYSSKFLLCGVNVKWIVVYNSILINKFQEFCGDLSTR